MARTAFLARVLAALLLVHAALSFGLSRKQVLKNAGVPLAIGLGLSQASAPALAELGPDGYPILKDDKPAPKKQMSAAEAQCKYGQVGTDQWKEACREMKKETGEKYDSSKAGKSLGGAYAM